MDQYHNKVDKEVWVPLKANDWLGSEGVGTVPPPAVPMPVPLDSYKQWSFAHADGSIGEDRYRNEHAARTELQQLRAELKGYGIPEEYWPVLMERTVETVAGSWKPLDV